MDARALARFWTKVKVLPGRDACWEWQASLLGNGYGQFKLDGAPHYAHRVAWELTNGRPIPDGKNVCHRCDNPVCVNPDHLFVGDPADNVADAQMKGRREPIHRSRRGERNNFAKVTAEQVIEMRLMASRGYRQQDIADKFSISRPAVSLIITRKNWKHL